MGLADLPATVANVHSLAEKLAVASAKSPLRITGVWGGVRALASAAIATSARPVLVVLPAAADADIVAGDLRALGAKKVQSLPLSAAEHSAALVRDEDYAQRIGVLKSIDDADGPGIITAYVGGVMQPVPSPQTLAAATRTFAVGDEVPPEDICRFLAEAGFAATTAVQLPGEFASRGGILDLFSNDQPGPLRIEFFGDEIESIRYFDLASQRSTGSVDSIEIAAIGMPVQSDDGSARIAGVAADASVADYLPDDTVVVVVDPPRVAEAAAQLFQRSGGESRLMPYEKVEERLSKFTPVQTSEMELDGDGDSVHLETETADAFAMSLGETTARLEALPKDYAVLIVGDTPADGQRMSELFAETQLARSGRLNLQIAQISGGFRWNAGKTIVLSGAELFHRSPVRRGRTRARGKPITSMNQLETGDLVVHLSHGIGLYRGLHKIEKNGQHLEHLTIEFDGGTKIYVPASRIGLIQRYVGGTKTVPKLAKIGGQAWQAKRKAAESAVTDMAGDLLELQAERATRSGIAFDGDNDWQKQFDASFPYVETPDQVTAIAAVKSDMETPVPMDRLICGDVGYGKTEVAMRAAFKAVTSGYQVAVLVPTTVLAEQHFHNFTTRMAEFPVEIAKLSRFVDRKSQREVVSGLKSGKVDIVIGTHRLASKDVDFKNLGLVVIDEEQRFGVAVKERLKTLHSNVDVLTLSATPIPRTLHMALVGVRDISNLETPPAERRSVETNVIRWDDTAIRRAIVRELNRGGQMFFVHNRIGDMGRVLRRIEEHNPELRIQTGHGQMGEGELEDVMVRFIHHEFDLLLATTIIESGLDIPNANTIFIDNADNYGLANLHQLRGRVGRYKHQAYCYLLVDPAKHLSPEASKRLRAIEEFSQMGAGFAISMRDLEIRGAGNLLGSQQSGHIAAVGYELYCQLLEDAVRQAQDLPPKLSADVDVDLPVEAYLPEDYVPDLRHKIDLYRRIAKIEMADEITELREELQDRFGDPPPPALRMLEIAELRLDAAAWLIRSITTEKRFIVLRYTSRQRIEQLVKHTSVPVRVVDRRRAYIPTDAYDMNVDQAGTSWLQLARATLHIG